MESVLRIELLRTVNADLVAALRLITEHIRIPDHGMVEQALEALAQAGKR